MESTLICVHVSHEEHVQNIQKIEPDFFNLGGEKGINSKLSIPPAYLAWRAGTITLFLLGS